MANNSCGIALKDDFKGDMARLEMSRYIDLGIYHAVEKSHPYYVEMIAEISRRLVRLQKTQGDLRVLEFGAGTGLATEDFVKCSGLSIDALELDEKCCELLGEHLGGLVTCICGDAVTFVGRNGYDAMVSVFAHDHIHYDKGPDLVANIHRNLKPGGVYIMGGELLPHYSNDTERKEALHKYHGFIVDAALREEHFELAQIEINALKSGLYKIGDFKRHEKLFEIEMLSQNFRLLSKAKMGPEQPDDVGGVFVYAFEAI